MFSGLGRLATRHPWLVILGWVVVSVVIIATAPKLSATSDQSEFLPSKYESIRAADLQTAAFPQQSAVGAILVFDRQDGGPLTTADSADVQKIASGLQPKLDPVFAGIAAQPPSQNKLVQIAVVGIAKDKNPYDPAATDAAKQLRVDGQALVKGTDLRLGVTGPAAQALDSQEASKNAEAIVGIATLLLILVLMILIFRSVILAVLPILVIGLVSQVAVGSHRGREQGLRPQDRQLDPGDLDRRPVRDRDRLHLVLPVPLPRTAARGPGQQVRGRAGGERAPVRRSRRPAGP